VGYSAWLSTAEIATAQSCSWLACQPVSHGRQHTKHLEVDACKRCHSDARCAWLLRLGAAHRSEGMPTCTFRGFYLACSLAHGHACTHVPRKPVPQATGLHSLEPAIMENLFWAATPQLSSVHPQVCNLAS
jgi:hypothetical protein